MALTPSEVEQKTFSTALRGYDLNEVDDFLDDVVMTIRDLQEELAEAKTSKKTTAATPSPAVDASAVGRALIAAQEAADAILADARAEAETIIADARTEAETWSTERDAKKAAADAEIEELDRHISSVRSQLAVLATAVADRLDEMDEALAAAGVGDDGGEDVGSMDGEDDSPEEPGQDPVELLSEVDLSEEAVVEEQASTF